MYIYFVISLDISRPECYDLLKHNCNNFSNEVVQFLIGRPIPDYIINLPSEALNRQELFIIATGFAKGILYFGTFVCEWYQE